MSNRPTCKWRGKSGATYEYTLYPIGTPMKEVDGNYIYAYRYKKDGRWYNKPIYIGEGNLKDRANVGSHERGGCIEDNGATHFHAHSRNSDRSKRLAEETDLRASYLTPCNRQ